MVIINKNRTLQQITKLYTYKWVYQLEHKYNFWDILTMYDSNNN